MDALGTSASIGSQSARRGVRQRNIRAAVIANRARSSTAVYEPREFMSIVRWVDQDALAVVESSDNVIRLAHPRAS